MSKNTYPDPALHRYMYDETLWFAFFWGVSPLSTPHVIGSKPQESVKKDVQTVIAASDEAANPQVSVENDVIPIDPAILVASKPKKKAKKGGKTSIANYTPSAGDTNANHDLFFCDQCSAHFGKRIDLQLHKERDHHLKEVPYPRPAAGFARPESMKKLDQEEKSNHTRRAFHIFQHGGESPSPCKACIKMGEVCIVDANFSSLCALCCYRSKRDHYCGAAGVQLRWVAD